MIHVDVVRTKLNDLEELISRIDLLTITLESLTTGKELKTVHSEFGNEVLKANQLVKLVKSQIDALEVSNSDFQSRNSDEKAKELDHRRITWAGFTNRLRTVLIALNKAQSAFERMFKKRTEARGLNQDLSPSANGSPTNKYHPIARAFADARADDDAIKKEDMKRLEKALVEIREVFLQIATLVEAQGEMLDCIEFSTVNAKNYAHQANVQLIKARSKQRTRTWLYLYFICSCIILLVVIVVLVLHFTDTLKSKRR